MTDHPREPAGARPRRGPAGQTPPRMPLWVKVVGIIAAAVLLALLALQLLGVVEHGPGRHNALGDARVESTLSVAAIPIAE